LLGKKKLKKECWNARVEGQKKGSPIWRHQNRGTGKAGKKKELALKDSDH